MREEVKGKQYLFNDHSRVRLREALHLRGMVLEDCHQSPLRLEFKDHVDGSFVLVELQKMDDRGALGESPVYSDLVQKLSYPVFAFIYFFFF